MGNQKELFNGPTVIEYKTETFNNLKKAIESISDEDIFNGDFEEWIQYFVEKYTIQPLKLYLDNVKPDLSETKVKVRNQWYPYNASIEPEYYERFGYEFKFKIPYSGDCHLLNLQPNSKIITNYIVSDFVESKVDEFGSFCLSIKFAVQELSGEDKDVKAYIERCFNRQFENYLIMIDQINLEIAPFNTSLRERTADLLKSRKNRAKHKNRLCNILHIPLKKNPNAPNLNPVPLVLVKKTNAKPPRIVQPSTEYCISDQDYEYILKVIHQCCTVMEEIDRTSNKFEEEELRDLILAMLSTHYLNNAGGETFRREGKTDILIPYENRAAFIAECKIWHGIKQFEEAVKQLFSYSTWKDIKVAVIIFNKTNKDFLSILKKIQGWVEQNTVSHSKQKENCWKCKIHDKKRNLDFEVAICVYDLSIDS